MQINSITLLCLTVTGAFAANVMAQAPNEECSGAIIVAEGINGPFSNAGSTTSQPWPCGLGGNDIWFLYVATFTGSALFNTCTPARTYDTTLQVFDGIGGCGGLVSLGCNDDAGGTCGFGSQLSIPVIQGAPYFVRVGGFSSATGTFELQIGTAATVATYGTGCVAISDSLYENFTTPAAFDLTGSGMTFLRTGAGSVAVPGLTSYVPPSASATALTLSDDSETTVNLSGSFPYGAAGSTNSLVVCSNAFVSVASGNGASFVPDVNAFLTASQTAWRSWHDYNPARSGSGQVKFEQVGAIAYVTWDGVLDFSTASTLPSTLQFQFDLATGNVHIHWVSMSGGGNGHLVGFSPGGSSNDGGSQDLSVALAGGITIPPINVAPLTLAATTGVRPIVNTVMSLETANITPTAPFGAVLFSWTQFDPGISLAPVGMAGCFQYTGGEVTFLFFPAGAPTAVTTFTVPNAPGLTMHAQSAVFDPASGLTVLGAVSSNGLTMGLGSI